MHAAERPIGEPRGSFTFTGTIFDGLTVSCGGTATSDPERFVVHTFPFLGLPPEYYQWTLKGACAVL